MMSDKDKDREFEVIEFSMLKKRVFVPLSGLGSFTVQTLLYPLVLLRIRLQLQEGVQVYRGLIHATSSIIREEGFRGLYSGYFIKSAQIVSGICYASTYETIRDATSAFENLGPSGRSFLGGAAASLVAQSMVVPIDIISQHIMVLSRHNPNSSGSPAYRPGVPPTSNTVRIDQIRALTPIRLRSDELSSSWSRFRSVTSYIARKHGLRGFYSGYVISLCTFVPSSALWWGFYDKICRLIASLPSELFSFWPVQHFIGPRTGESRGELEQLGDRLPRLAIQLISAPLAGIAAATIVNPLDCVRVRMQVGHVNFVESVRTLWATEGLRWFVKGLSARLIQTGIFSFWLVMIYEPVKVFCLKDEFRDRFRASSSNW